MKTLDFSNSAELERWVSWEQKFGTQNVCDEPFFESVHFDDPVLVRARKQGVICIADVPWAVLEEESDKELDAMIEDCCLDIAA